MVSKVKSTKFDKILYELKTLMGNVHRHVVVHRQKVVIKKTGFAVFLHCVIVVYIFCRLKNWDLEPQKWVFICNTFFTDLLLDANKEVTFMKAAKKIIPEFLGKYNLVHI